MNAKRILIASECIGDGGFGFAEAIRRERKFPRDAALQDRAGVDNLILPPLAQHVLGMPRSY